MPHRFVHAADLHLDSPFRGVGRLRPGLDERLQEASLEAWDRLVGLCLDEQASFLLLAGDLFDSDVRSPRAESRVRRGLERLASAGVRVLAVHGNHDPLQRDADWSAVEGTTVFRPGKPQSVRLEVPGGPDVTVHGVSFGRREERDNLARGFARGDAPGLHVGLLHCMVGALPGHDPYAPCSLDDLRAARMDYWALGHVHQPQTLAEDPLVVYAGALQGRSPRPGERGPHGAYVVEFDAAGVRPPRFAPLDDVRFTAVDVPIDGLEDQPGLERRLEEAAAAAAVEADGRLVILRATLTGRGPLHRRFADPDACESLRVALDEAAIEPLVVWERVVAATRGSEAVDADALRGAPGIAGDVVAVADGLAGDEAGLVALLAAFEAEIPDRAARGLADEDPAGRLAAARDLVLERLLDEGDAP